ncbi:hypothetical protein PPGU16_77650 (plasmid) [Paraburkholderia largidicola]|uniref:Uncharacterized protein n=1 Tax=Paraburkholderia largidicola TaxID=3014751 RepID=A0A7I8C2N4_9BURK|nr:hypothetical protein PPGU16_77650 [Paraburkholderia sp. PGU16]
MVADVGAGHLEPARSLAEIAGIDDLDQQRERVEVHGGPTVKEYLTLCQLAMRLSIPFVPKTIPNRMAIPLTRSTRRQIA